MPTISGDTWRVTAKLLRGVDDIQNVYHIHVSGPNVDTDANLLTQVAAVLDTAYDFLDSNMWTGVDFDSIEAYNVSQDYWVGEVPWPGLTSGGDGAGTLPAQTSPIVLFTTAVLNSLGRKFLPPMSLNSIDTDGSPTTSLITLLGSYAALIITGYTSANYNLDFGNWRELGDIFIDFAGSTIRDYYATQRRRYVGRGS